MKCVDFHSHIIPYIDDGAKNAKTSISLLKEAYRQGVTDIVVTPHFYGDNKDISLFINRREAMLEIMQDRVKKENAVIPSIYTGAEVAYKDGISLFDNLRALCIQDTDYILLELPYSYWDDRVFAELNDILKNHGLVPIIAHVERYLNVNVDYKTYEKLFDLDIILQFNARSFCNLFSRRTLKEHIDLNNDLNVVLGSDCHDTRFRSIQFLKACKHIERSYGKDFLERIHKTSMSILDNKKFFE